MSVKSAVARFLRSQRSADNLDDAAPTKRLKRRCPFSETKSLITETNRRHSLSGTSPPSPAEAGRAAEALRIHANEWNLTRVCKIYVSRLIFSVANRFSE